MNTKKLKIKNRNQNLGHQNKKKQLDVILVAILKIRKLQEKICDATSEAF